MRTDSPIAIVGPQHVGEVRENNGLWKEVPAPLPESIVRYHPQYPTSQCPLGINTFLKRSCSGALPQASGHNCTICTTVGTWEFNSGTRLFWAAC